MAPHLAERLERWNAEETEAGVPSESRSFLIAPGGAAPDVLVLHGAGGGPHDLRDLAEDLARSGHRCLCPLLPAHGRGPVALGGLRFEDLRRRALACYDVIASAGDAPFVVAQSFGVVLGIHLAIERPVPALVALAPALRPFVTGRALWLLPLALVRPRLALATYRWQMEARRAIETTRPLVARVACPLLVLHSTDDRSVSPRGARELFEDAGSQRKELELLEGQGHVLSEAPHREELVFSPVRSFLDSVYCSGS